MGFIGALWFQDNPGESPVEDMQREKVFCETTDLLDKPKDGRMRLWQVGSYSLYFLAGDQLVEPVVFHGNNHWFRVTEQAGIALYRKKKAL